MNVRIHVLGGESYCVGVCLSFCVCVCVFCLLGTKSSFTHWEECPVSPHKGDSVRQGAVTADGVLVEEDVGGGHQF